MNSTSYVFQIVKSLTRTEKRFVSVRLKSNKYTDFELIFKSYNQLLSFDNDEKLKHLKIKDIDVKKAQLNQIILECLFVFHKSTESNGFDLQMGDLLLQKKLYQLAYEMVKKQLKSASKNEDLALKIILLERMLILSEYISIIESDKILLELEKTVSLYKNIVKMTVHLQKIKHQINRYFFIRDEEQEKFYTFQLTNWKVNFQHNLEFIHSRKHEITRLEIPYFIYASECKWKKAFEFSKRMYSLFRLEMNMKITSDQRQFIFTTYQYGVTALLANEFEIAKNVYIVLETRMKEFKSLEIQNLAQVKLIQLQLVAFNRNITFRDLDLNFFELFIENNYSFLQKNRLDLICFDLGKSFLAVQNYRKAKKWFGKIELFADLKSDKSLGFFTFQRILMLLCQIETNETENVKQNAHLLKIWLKRNNLFYHPEKVILDFLTKKYLRFNDFDNAKKKELLINFHTEWLKLMEIPLDRNVEYYFDFGLWCERKLQENLI